jgi:hypothetical protein
LGGVASGKRHFCAVFGALFPKIVNIAQINAAEKRKTLERAQTKNLQKIIEMRRNICYNCMVEIF